MASSRFGPRVARGVMLFAAIAGLALGWSALAARFSGPARDSEGPPASIRPISYRGSSQINFEGGVDWINVARPIRPEDLKGKVVLLDFWTFCCINCHHVLPDLARLEQKYKNELVVIGVHTAKFPAEKITANIRKKVAEYQIKHPVVNDANQAIWGRYGVESWPTLVLFDANGQNQGFVAGEGHYDVLDAAIGNLVRQHRQKGELDETQLYFPAEIDKEKRHEAPLLYPGKVLADADGGRLFIADTGHNRVVVTGLDGSFRESIGTGAIGHKDGPYDAATFHRPQGMCLVGETLYVADTENHLIRAVDLDARRVGTVAGDGRQSQRRAGSAPALETGLNSPWDLLPVPGHPQILVIAMAGPHQLWKLDLERGVVSVWAGSGRENIVDGSPEEAAFAQPSGLATDGRIVFVADSEVSGIRAVNLASAAVETIVGVNLFGFGDVDGKGPRVRLQHCLGVAYGDGVLYVADTYNNKIKVCNPKTRTVKSLLGDRQPGSSDDPPRFDEPGGLSLAGRTLFVADTNNHAVRAINLDGLVVRSLDLASVPTPGPPAEPPTFPNPTVIDAPAITLVPGGEVALEVNLSLPKGFKLSDEAPMPYLVEAPGHPEALAESPVTTSGGQVDPPSPRFRAVVPLAEPAEAGDTLTLRLSASSFVCKADSGFCTIKNYTWNVPITFAEDGAASVSLTNQARGGG